LADELANPLEVAHVSSTEGQTVAAEQVVWLIGPDDLNVPLTAHLRYSSADPYAVRMSFDSGLPKPVEWAFDRDLLAAALHGPEGVGDVRAWPSPGRTAVDKIMNIVLGNLDGYARFETSAAEIELFLARTFELVPAGQESDGFDIDAELAELLSQA
jgi:hypothetical protein